VSTIYVTIRRRDLERLDACKPGVALFDSLAAAQGRTDRVRVKWSVAAQLWLSRDYPDFAVWCRAQGLTPWISCADSDLSWSNLSGSNLSRSNLSWSNLSGSDLSRSDLSRSDLSGSDLSRSDLSRSDLSRSNLSWSNLSWSNLSRSDLSGSDLSGSDLSGSDLSGSNLSGSNLSWSNLSGCYRRTDDHAIAGWVVRNGVLVRAEDASKASGT